VPAEKLICDDDQTTNKLRSIRLMANERLKQQIARLRGVEARCLQSRRRYAFYVYLSAVYRLYRRLRRRKAAKQSARRIAALFALKIRKDSHPMRVIIDATSNADAKTKWRWSQGLRYAWRERHTWTDFSAFLRDHGGAAGCARDFAALTGHPPRGFVAVGGPERLPRVPLYIDKDLLAADGEWRRQPV
jgi:hypothetical protein